MLQSTNEPTESRRLKDASFMKRFRKCLMKVSSNPLKVLGHHPLCSFRYLAEPLLSLLKSGVEFHWGPEEVEAFHSLKKALTSDPVLGMYDERASTEIHTDASGYGIGAVLVQIQNNVEKVIAYASRTDKSRKELFHHRKGMSCHLTPTLFEKSSGRGNGNTRQIFSSHDEYEPCDGTEKRSRPCEIKTLSNSSKNEEFRFIDGILCRKNFDPDGKLWLPVIPKHLRADILRHFHDAPTAGHLGFAKTYDRIRKRFYWPGMYRNVVRFPKSAHGNKWIIVCTDYSTRYAITKALPTAEVAEIAKFLLEEIVLRHGAPRVIITDRGAVFRIQTCFLSRRLV
ncbi:transposon Ty3-I Gag-Pol polyprotein [Trichonephila clavipes]|uniref:RNA-directed DNA polymerase n=1 Tax=Trichonephila clavipes TaxID=2585209 RepID=A0A8X6RMY1_TRICX|nr:transposon Ty3-I Gag-Pol polyprotein [Trichonephila clavipes]